MSEQKIEVGDVVRHNDREIEVTKVMEVYLGQGTIRAVKIDGVWVSSGLVELVRKADPYHGITLPEPPAGYRLAKWGEESKEALFYKQSRSEWVRWQGPLVNRNTTYDATEPRYSIFAIPLDQSSVSDEFRKAAEIEANTPINSPVSLQPNCKWVKPGWAVQPTDFYMNANVRITAESVGASWCIAANDKWQRPQLLDTDLFYLMKCIKTAVHNLPESEKQEYIWEMLQVQSQAGKLLSEIRERAEAAAKAAADSKATEGGQP